MLESKKKIFIIGAIIVFCIVGVIAYYFVQKNGEEYIDFEDEFSTYINSNTENYLENNIEKDNLVIEENAKIVVHISGQVVNPGVISLKEGARVIDAVNEAGGLTPDADISKVNLAYVLSDAQKIYIPSLKEKEDVVVISEENESDKIITKGEGKNEEKTENLMININTASETELQKLPGIGSSIASRIVTYRKENGKFSTIEEIQNVSGIGTSKFNNIKNYICVK